jgi:hypothetical protein
VSRNVAQLLGVRTVLLGKKADAPETFNVKIISQLVL